MSIFLVTYIRKNPFELSNIHTHPYTNIRTPSYFRCFKGPYINLYLYSKRLEMSICLVTYIRKNPFELSNIRTPIHPYTKTYHRYRIFNWANIF